MPELLMGLSLGLGAGVRHHRLTSVLMERITGILSFELLQRGNALYRFWAWGDPPAEAPDRYTGPRG